MSDQDPSVFITPKEMARALGVSLTTIYGYLAAGVIPCDHVGVKPLVHRADFEVWLKGGKAACHWLAQPPVATAEPTELKVRVNGVEVAVLGERKRGVA